MRQLQLGILLVFTASSLSRPGFCENGKPGDANEALDPLYSTPFVYQNTGHGVGPSFSMQYELGYGSRESRNFTQEGIEQGVRGRFQILDWLAIEGFGGLVVDARRTETKGYAGSFEVIGRLLNQNRHHINLDLGGGYIYDYRGDHVPRVRLTLGWAHKKFDIALGSLVEIPVGNAGRDEADVVTTLAFSYAFKDWLRIGWETGFEDIEGFFESEESEGGAKTIFGPTFAIIATKHIFLKLNTAGIYAFTSNQRFEGNRTKPDALGFLGRLILGWTFY